MSAHSPVALWVVAGSCPAEGDCSFSPTPLFIYFCVCVGAGGGGGVAVLVVSFVLNLCKKVSLLPFKDLSMWPKPYPTGSWWLKL